MTYTQVHSPFSDGERAARPDPGLYPDVAAVGSLQNALQAELEDSAKIEVLPGSSPGWRYVGARVEGDGRYTSVVLGNQQRAFTMAFWERGVSMAKGATADLHEVAGAIRIWSSGSRVRELASAWPFVSFSGFAEAYERGEAAAYKWRQYYENEPPIPQLTRLHPFVAVAIHEPRLHALLPFTSMYTLGFSKTVGYPYSHDCPWVTPTDGGLYRVTGPDGREWGTADAVGAVALVLAALDEATAD